jgi:hypothetical protein
MHTPLTLWMSFLHVQIICIIDLHDCVNLYSVIFLYVVYLNIPNCNHRINQERYILPHDGYMLSETCRRNDDGPLVF